MCYYINSYKDISFHSFLKITEFLLQSSLAFFVIPSTIPRQLNILFNAHPLHPLLEVATRYSVEFIVYSCPDFGVFI